MIFFSEYVVLQGSQYYKMCFPFFVDIVQEDQTLILNTPRSLTLDMK